MNEDFNFLKETTKVEKKFLKILKKKGSHDDIPFYTSPNLIASNLYPFNQAANIINVIEVSSNIKILTFVTAEKISFFEAGQYIDVSVKKDNLEVTRSFYLIGSPIKSSFSNSTSIVVYNNETDWAISEIFNNWGIDHKFNFSKPKGNFGISLSQLEKNYLLLVNRNNIIPCLSIVQSLIDSNYTIKLMIMYEIDELQDIYWIRMLNQILSTKNKEQSIVVNYFITASNVDKDDTFIMSLNSKRLFFEPIKAEHIQELFLKFVFSNIRYLVAGDYKFNTRIKSYIDSFGSKEVSIIYNDYFIENVNSNSFKELTNIETKTYNITWYVDDESIVFTGKIKSNQTIISFLEKDSSYIHFKSTFPYFFTTHKYVLVSGQVKVHPYFKVPKNNLYSMDNTFPMSDIKIKIL
ncbi:hypothetical protein ACJA25_01095 [Mycoplasmopsis hyopharyngis]|uniref:hypothetical protein n=1 Tax=Mycoplasmopsis hyopharyngis TaxID=29558 RepID=UPI003873A131